MTDPFWTAPALFLSAAAAGAMNSVAGGGTLLTFPALTLVVSPAVANATSTVALLPGSLAGALGFRKEVAESRRFVLRMLAPSVAGGLLGAWLVVEDEKAFGHLIPWLILTAALLFLFQPVVAKAVGRHATDTHAPGPLLTIGLIGFQFVIAVYGGYFGAGIGILMLTTLGFMGLGSIHKVNGVKTALAATINAASVVVFVGQGTVEWRYAGVMAGGAVLGGYAGARLSRRLPAKWVRAVVIVTALGLSGWYFWKEYGG
jgi:uncharacterized membrane protein YfcA